MPNVNIKDSTTIKESITEDTKHLSTIQPTI